MPPQTETHLPQTLPNGPFALDAYIPSTADTSTDLTNNFYEEQRQIHGGSMDQFVLYDAAAKGLTMGYYETSGLPLAEEVGSYTLCDHFFHGVFGGSLQNHIFLISAGVAQFPNAPIAIKRAVLDAQGAPVLDADGKPQDGPLTPDGYVVGTLYPSATPHPPGVPPEQLVPPQTFPTPRTFGPCRTFKEREDTMLARLIRFFARPALDGPKATLLLRLMVGGVFFWEGLLKFVYVNQGVGRFTKLGFPVPELLAPAIAYLEIGGGLLLLFGLATRWIALPFIIEMIVAILSTKVSIYFGTSPLPMPPSPPKLGAWAVLHEIRSDWAQLLTCAYLLCAGPGPWSLDAFLRRKRARQDMHP